LNITTIELHNNHEQKGRVYDVDEKSYKDNTYLVEEGETSRRMNIMA